MTSHPAANDPVGAPPDPIFSHPRLAAIYDVCDPDRSDLDLYLQIAANSGAESVVDVGCGTGTLALLLAAEGMNVTGVEPAQESLRVAQAKAGADSVRWLTGGADRLAALEVVNQDLATMTANVAQVFVGDADWRTALAQVHHALKAGGVLAFEVRDPAARAWEEWNRQASFRRVEMVGVAGADAEWVYTWVDLTRVALPLVSFRWTWQFSDGEVLTSDTTLCFRERDQVAADLEAGGFEIEEILDAPDRPGKEFVFVARSLT